VTTPANLTRDQKWMAAFSHFAIFPFGIGMVVPAIFWASQRKKSRYVSFHALQALAWQILLPVVLLLLTFALSLLLFLVLVISLSVSGRESMLSVLGVAGVVCLVVILVATILLMLPSLVGSIMCLLGKDFQYPWLGAWIRRRTILTTFDPDSAVNALPIRQVDEFREEELVMALCHFAAFIPLFGLFVPLVIWIANMSARSRLWYQAVQATTFQGILVLLTNGLGGVGSFLVSLILVPLSSMTSGGMISGSSGSDILFVGFLLLVLLGLTLISMIILATFQTLALVAGVRTLRHQDYYYPFLNQLLAKINISSPGLDPIA